MGDEKETWKVKTLDEILQEKKRRRELEEKSDPKRPKNTDDRESKRDTPEEGELRDHRMEITIRNSPYTREDSTEDRGEEDESLAIKPPPQQMTRKDKSYHRKEEKRKDKRRHRSHSAEGAGKHMRTKDKEKEREDERRPRQWQDDNKSRRDYERQKRRDQARDHSQADCVSGPVSHHRGAAGEEYADKSRPRHRSRSRSRSPVRQQRETRAESSEQRRAGYTHRCVHLSLSLSLSLSLCVDCVFVLSGSGSEDEEGEENDEEESSSQSEGEEEGESGSDSVGSEHSEVPESRFDHDSEVSAEEEEEEEEGAEEAGDVTPQSPSHSATPEDNYIPESPPISPVELKKELPKYLPALQGCRSVEEFQCLNRIEEGTYGVVYRAKDKKTDEIVALKRLKMEKEKEGFPITSLREINTILKAQHPNIVTVREIVVGSNMDKIYIVMNYVEHDLKSLMETMKQPFLPGEIKTLMIQLLRGVRHLHDNWILHRDLKTSNLLLSHKGILKIGDFGLAREYGSPLKPYTPVVVTLWYRSPDLLLGAKEYSTAVDMWSVGCIFGELLTQKPLFPGKSEIDQINKVFKDLGSPSEKIWPGYSELPAVKKMTFTEYPYNNLRKRFGALLSDQGFDLMNKFLTYCPAKRISADEALKHEYFRESPLPIEPSMFPTWPAKSEQQRVKRGTSPRPPEGGQDFSQLGDDDLKDTGFHLTTANQGASKAGPGFSLKF
uniref:cyclin-dependent kinase n=1 Tax=Cyprinus carpio TaxID=7962 RepID=A0A8C2L4C9_CYPCA